MKKITNIIFSLEFALVLFLTAAYFKEGLNFLPSWLDLTFLFFLVTGVGALMRLYKKPIILKGSLSSIALYGLIVFIAVVSYLYHGSNEYANSKLLKLVVVTTWSMVGSLLIIRSKDSLYKFFKGLLLIAVMMAAGGIYEFLMAVAGGYYNGTLTVFEMSYIAIGRTVMLGVIFIVCMRFFSDNEKASGKRTVIILLLMLFSVAVSGSRMPLIAFAVILAGYFLLSFRFSMNDFRIRKSTLLFMVVSIVGIAVFILGTVTGKFGDALSRMASLFSGDDASSIERIVRYEVSWDMFLENKLFGQGFASFPQIYMGNTQKDYPHNIFFELVAELGIVGVLPFIILMVYALYNGFYKYRRKHGKLDALQLTLIGMFVFFFIQANVAGDITDNRVLFSFAALLIISPYLMSSGSNKVGTNCAVVTI